MIIGDLDRFKEVNDRFGHAAGDRCLRQVAAVLTEILRIEDACFRWGGDEFAVLLANSDRPDAERLAARVRARVAELCVIDGEVEVGITCATAELAASQSASEFIAIADELLLALKGDPNRRPRAPGGPGLRRAVRVAWLTARTPERSRATAGRLMLGRRARRVRLGLNDTRGAARWHRR